MTVYVIADIKVTDSGWVPEYAASVHDIVHKHGGKYLSRSGNVKTLEGKPLDTTLIALLQFPSAEAAEAFVNDPEYAPHAAARQVGSESRFQLRMSVPSMRCGRSLIVAHPNSPPYRDVSRASAVRADSSVFAASSRRAG